MAKMSKSMSVASRLAAATALTGTLAACDGRFGRASDALFGPLPSQQAPELQRAATPPAAPGNPVYIGGSQQANDQLYQQTYGAPLQGSGQAIPEQPTYATSVYEDNTINATPVAPSYSAPIQSYETQTVPLGSYSAPADVYSAPVDTYSAPAGSTSFPTIGSEPVYLPQSSLPQSTIPQSEIFSDASALNGARDIEPLLDGGAPSEPYGSTASIRYTVAEEALPTVDMTSAPLPQYDAPVAMIDQSQLGTPYAPLPGPIETMEVASLSGAVYAPMPRMRPALVKPVAQTVAVAAPIPTARPQMMRTPIPTLRPMNANYVSGIAITDAPALTAPPKMIEVEAVFVDEAPVIDVQPEIRTAALDPTPAPQPPINVQPELTVTKPDDLETEMASIDTSKLKLGSAKDLMNDASTSAPAVEIASDIGDLKELSGTSWRLSTLNGTDIDARAELHFDGTSGFAGGQGICNNYGGEFSETLKGEFDMANIFSTETECADMALEKQYIVALESAANYRMAPGLKELMLLGPDGQTIATFQAF